MLHAIPFAFARKRAPVGNALCPFCSHSQAVPAMRGAVLCSSCGMYFPVGPPALDARAEGSEQFGAPVAPLSLLPPGWEKLEDESGEPYYHHAASGATQWDQPSETQAAQQPSAPGQQQLAEQAWTSQQDEQLRAHRRRLDSLAVSLRTAQNDAEAAESDAMSLVERTMATREQLERELHRVERQTEQAHYKIMMLQRAIAAQRMLPDRAPAFDAAAAATAANGSGAAEESSKARRANRRLSGMMGSGGVPPAPSAAAAPPQRARVAVAQPPSDESLFTASGVGVSASQLQSQSQSQRSQPSQRQSGMAASTRRRSTERLPLIG
jgi:hypothetical protein